MKLMQTPFKWIALALALLLGGIALGLATGDNGVKEAKAMMEKFFSGSVSVESIKYLPALELYEVVLGGSRVVYLDKTRKYVFVGDVVDIKSRRSLTEEKIAQLQAADVGALPLENAIKVVKGNGKLRLIVFTDPECPFCKRLEQELSSIDNITIYEFLYPIEGLHPGSMQKAVQLWCQPENRRVEIWRSHMKDNAAIPRVATCDNPIAQNVKLGEKLGIQGTPTILLPDGRRIDGLPQNLKKFLEQNTSK
ncbi:MAG: DsbC family protein [Neisseriaceae bacterium]